LELKEPSEHAREILLTHIQLGSSDTFAEKVMEENLFSCSFIDKGEFLELKNIDYIYCDRYDRKSFFISRRWQVAIILKNKKVEDIKVSTGLLAP
jgi:hypothetical protein